MCSENEILDIRFKPTFDKAKCCQTTNLTARFYFISLIYIISYLEKHPSYLDIQFYCTIRNLLFNNRAIFKVLPYTAFYNILLELLFQVIIGLWLLYLIHCITFLTTLHVIGMTWNKSAMWKIHFASCIFEDIGISVTTSWFQEKYILDSLFNV